jgi:uncharacterized protein YvpB
VEGEMKYGKISIFFPTLIAFLFSCATIYHKESSEAPKKESTGDIVLKKNLKAHNKPLPVVFKCQGPPGDRGKSKNCGQTSALMVMYYHNGMVPTVQGIKDIDDWLFLKYGDPINNYNGSGTNAVKLEALVKEHGGFTHSYKADGWDLDDLRKQIDNGLPVIASVTARYLSNRGYKYAWGHVVVVIGYTEDSIICNDPARSHGAKKYYSNNEFSKAFASKNGSVVVVVPNASQVE